MPQVCRAKFRVRWIRHESGERFVLLIGPENLPVGQPCVFLTSQFRNPGCAANTLQKVAEALKCLYEWTYANDIHLHERLSCRQFLGRREIESLLRQLWLSAKEIQPDKVVPIRCPRAGVERARALSVQHRRRVSPEYFANRLTYVQRYLTWLAQHHIDESGVAPSAEQRALLEEMGAALRQGMPKNTKITRKGLRQGLSQEEHDRLLLIVDPQSDLNPFHPVVRRRNHIVMRLFETGLRHGELLSLKVTDFDFQQNIFWVHRRHDDPEDGRLRQPVVKTRGRCLPISDELSDLVLEYVMNDRNSVSRRKKHRFLLATHAPGPHIGEPLSSSGLREIFNKIKASYPEFSKNLSPHIMRYTANDRFSEAMDDLGVNPAEEARLRNEKFGWAEGSTQGALYSRRHITKKANEAFLEMQRSAQIRRNFQSVRHNDEEKREK